MRSLLNKGLTIFIPTFNNLPYLKKCIEGIRKHTTIKYEIIVHVNGCNDGTAKYLRECGIKYTRSPKNIGVSSAMNCIRKIATSDLFVFFNDDFYALPKWDIYLIEYIENSWCGINTWISSTMIEPRGCNSIAVQFDCGNTVNSFLESKLISNLELIRNNMVLRYNVYNPPCLMSSHMWDSIGGYDERVFAKGSDIHIVKKVYDNGGRFVQIGTSLVYHFMSKTVRRISDNKKDAQRKFVDYYGMTVGCFKDNCMPIISPSNYLILATKRSGHHAIINWIRKHTLLPFYNNCCFGWSQKEFRTVLGKIKVYFGIVNIEDFNYSYYKQYQFDDFDFVKNGKVIVIVREKRNWLASSYQRKYFNRHDHKAIYLNLNKRHKNRRGDINPTRIEIYQSLYENRNNHYCIYYDKFICDKDYRKKIAVDLGFEFNDIYDSELNNMAVGSSFDRLDYKNNALKMNVLNRYQQVKNDEEYKGLLEKLL